MLPLTTDVTLDDIDNMTVAEVRRYAADIDVALIELLRDVYADIDTQPLSAWFPEAVLNVVTAAGLTIAGCGRVSDEDPNPTHWEIEFPLDLPMDDEGKHSFVAISRDATSGHWIFESHFSRGDSPTAARVRDFGAAMCRAAYLLDQLNTEAN